MIHACDSRVSQTQHHICLLWLLLYLRIEIQLSIYLRLSGHIKRLSRVLMFSQSLTLISLTHLHKRAVMMNRQTTIHITYPLVIWFAFQIAYIQQLINISRRNTICVVHKLSTPCNRELIKCHNFLIKQLSKNRAKTPSMNQGGHLTDNCSVADYSIHGEQCLVCTDWLGETGWDSATGEQGLAKRHHWWALQKYHAHPMVSYLLTVTPRFTCKYPTPTNRKLLQIWKWNIKILPCIIVGLIWYPLLNYSQYIYIILWRHK
jgi:hypothetical protein